LILLRPFRILHLLFSPSLPIYPPTQAFRPETSVLFSLLALGQPCSLVRYRPDRKRRESRGSSGCPPCSELYAGTGPFADDMCGGLYRPSAAYSGGRVCFGASVDISRAEAFLERVYVPTLRFSHEIGSRRIEALLLGMLTRSSRRGDVQTRQLWIPCGYLR
jgi:hypothetical protein